MMTTMGDVRPLSTSGVNCRISRVASEPLGQPSSFLPARPHNVSPQEDLLITQLGRLASQHHESEYNRLKFGSNGSPLIYVPYSVQMPDHYREMQAHQLRCAEQEAWWPHHRQASIRDAAAGRYAFGRIIGNADKPSAPPGYVISTDLHEQLAAAISSSIIPTVDGRHATTPTPQPHWQTSETHPIVISTIIPTELLPAISSCLRPTKERHPVVFDVPASHTLDCIVPAPGEPVEAQAQTIQAPHIPLVAPIIAPRPTPGQSSTHSLAKSLKLSNLFWVHPTVRRTFLGDINTLNSSKKRIRPMSLMGPSLASRSPINDVVSVRPKVVRNCSSPAMHKTEPEVETSRIGVESPVLARSALINLSVPPVPLIPSSANVKVLGNLYMSSCPGKKVRLNGPVRGRNTVCRDLRSDLTRIKGVGVACIVCCLDDNELQSLGVEWSDYVQTAAEFGIDILRIPIPEGLAPSNAATLDCHLDRLIDSYTLLGSAILIHCRGGVGRAGIIACCWMLKLGLCGWLESASTSTPDLVGEETLRLVERLIIVVRRRRSPKAVETYEQVKFLVDYVEFLRERATASKTLRSLSMDLFADWAATVE